MEKNWFRYIIFSGNNGRTYIGSTVDINKRIRQHNGDIKGGARYTKGGQWEYYCVIYNLTQNEKNLCLSEEWHLKWMTNKIKTCSNPHIRRRLAIQRYLGPRKYRYIIFLSRKYLHLIPIVNSRTFIYIMDDFDHYDIENKIYDYVNFHKSVKKLK